MADGINTLPDAFNSPVAGTKYALKQVYRDPVLRKAYVYFIDANSGTVLNSLNGYTLWEAGLGVGTPATGDPAKPATPKEEPIDWVNSQIRSDGFDNPQSGFNVDNLYGRRDGTGAMGNTPGQTVRSFDYGNNVGRITVEGAGPATPGTYNVNTPSQAGRTPSDIVSGTRQTDRVSQGFNPTNPTAGYSFGPAPVAPASGGLQSSQATAAEVYSGLVDRFSRAYPELSPAEVQQAAAAFTGNFVVEGAAQQRNGVFNGAIEHYDSNRYNVGIASWTRDRATGLKDFAAKSNRDWRSIGVQLDWAVTETLTTHRGTVEAAAKAPNPTAASEVVRNDYEVAAPIHAQERAQYTQAVLTGDWGKIGAQAGQIAGGVPGETARQDIGFGLTQPGSDRVAGSSAPTVQSQSLMDLAGMSDLQGRVANANYSLADTSSYLGTPMDEKFSGPNFGAGYRTGTGLGPYDAPQSRQERTFTPEIPSFSSTPDFYGRERGTSRIGNNPTTGDEFAVARANEKATQDIFAQGPISERMLSGTPVANQQNVPGQPPSGPIDYGKIGSGSVVFSAESLQASGQTGRITTQGPISMVINDVLPDNAGLYLNDKNINIVYDAKTDRMAVIPNDKSTVQLATIANGMLAAKGKLDTDFVKENGLKVATPSQIAWDVMANANKYKDLIVSQEESRKIAEQIGPKSYIDEVPQIDQAANRATADSMRKQNADAIAQLNMPNAAVDPSTGRVTMTLEASSPRRDPSLNWQGVQTPNQGVLDYEAIANYNPAFDKGYGKLASDRAIREATTFDPSIAPPTGGFGTYTEAGKSRSEAEKVAAAFATNNYGIEMDSGMPGGVAMPSYNFAAQGPNLSGISPTVNRSFDPAGVGIGYDNGDYGLGGRSAGFGGLSRNSLSDMAGTSFGRGIDSGRQDTPTGANYDKYDWSGGYTGRGGSAQSTRGMDSPSEGGSRFGGSGLGTPDRGGGSSSSGGGKGYTGGGPTSGPSNGTPDRGGGRDSGAGAGGRGGSSPSTGSGGTGSQGGPGPAGGSGGFSSGSSGGGRGGGYTGGGPTGGPSSSGGYGQGGVGGGFGDNGGRR